MRKLFLALRYPCELAWSGFRVMGKSVGGSHSNWNWIGTGLGHGSTFPCGCQVPAGTAGCPLDLHLAGRLELSQQDLQLIARGFG